MWLKKGAIEKLLQANKITREGLAKAFDIRWDELNPVLDGEAEAGETLAMLLLAAFGAEEMESVIDWERTN